MRKRLLAVCLAAAALALCVDKPAFPEVDAILADLGKITGLAPRRNVPAERIDKDQLKAFIERRTKEAIRPAEVRAEELTLKKFGLVPQDFDLRKHTLELLTEQAAAFYDFRKKKLFVLDHSGTSMQQAALVHELAHALADQHFRLGKYLEEGSKSDDGSLARLAVTEGQASWLMSEHQAKGVGMSLRKSASLLRRMSEPAESGSGEFPVLDQAPLYIRETLIFPYTRGMRFQHAVIEKLGEEGFREVFRRPPASTQQVIHPELYFSGQIPTAPALPEIPDRRRYRTLTEGNVGELDHEVLLRQYGDKTLAEIAVSWRGGAYRMLEHKSGSHTVLLYASEWKDEVAARQFLEAYQRVLKGKWKSFAISQSTVDTIVGIGDDGRFQLRLAGRLVTSVEGLPAQ